MAFKTFVDGVALPASDLNTYLMKQTVIVCTSGTRPSSPNEGMTIFETDTDLYRYWNGTMWRTPPGALEFLARRSSTFTISADSTYFPIPFDSEVYDKDGVYDTSTGAFTAPMTGRVQFDAAVELNLASQVTCDALVCVASLTSGGAYNAEIARGSRISLTAAAWPSPSAVGLLIPGLVVSVTAGTKYGICIFVNAVGSAKTLANDAVRNQVSAKYVS